MAQTTDALSGADFQIEISDDGATWDDISGSTNAVNPGNTTIMSGETYTGDGAGPIITVGKREPIELDVRIVYTETAGEAFELVRAAADGNRRLYLRYSPGGGNVGDARYTVADSAGAAAAGVLTEVTYPEVDAGSGDPVLAGFKLKAAYLARSVIA